METVTTTPFGRRPVTDALLSQHIRAQAPAPKTAIDKWQVLRDLGRARGHYGLSDRTLSVLSVLLGFHGPRMLEGEAPLIVYASNASIGARAHGMPESTLRRHLAQLVNAGLLLRHDSPNGKRYVRHGGDGTLRAFGFDLRPLMLRAGEIAAQARKAEAEAREIASLREEITLRLRDLVKLSEHTGALDPVMDRMALARRHLRRRLSLAELASLRDQLTELVDKLLEDINKSLPHPEEMSGNDSQNERHIQDSDKDSYELKAESAETPLKDVSLAQLLHSCPDVLPYAEGRPVSWEDMLRLSARLAPMAGVDPGTWAEACRLMGAQSAAATLAAIVQRIDTIRSPGAYLRSLARKAKSGSFTPAPMIRALERQADRPPGTTH